MPTSNWKDVISSVVQITEAQQFDSKERINKIEQLLRSQNSQEASRLLWEWIKTGAINRSDFTALLAQMTFAK